MAGDVWRLTNWLTGNLAFALPCHRVFCSDAAVSMIFFSPVFCATYANLRCIEKKTKHNSILAICIAKTKVEDPYLLSPDPAFQVNPGTDPDSGSMILMSKNL